MVDEQRSAGGHGLSIVSAILNPRPLAQAQSPGGWVAFLPLLFILVIFYFLLILPAQRQRKRQQQMLGALKSGDRVITTGGILGTIVGIRENVIQLRIADQVLIEVLRSAIAGPQPTPGAPEEDKGKL